MINQLITTELCAKQYAMLHYPTSNEKLNSLLSEGLELFADMTQFQEFYRNGSLVEFSMTYLVPMIIKKLNQTEWLCPVEVPPTSELEMFWVLHPNGYIEMVRFNNYTKYGGWRDTWQDLKHDDIEMKGTKYAVINKPEAPQ